MMIRLKLITPLGLVCAIGVAPMLAAQQPPPINGVTGSVAVEGTMQKVYGAVNTVIVTTIDGVKHVLHFTKDLVVHGGKGAGVDALKGLNDGSSVVVHYTVNGGEASAFEVDSIGGEGLKETEGVVTRVDRRRKEITIKFDNGTTEVFQLTDRAAVDAGKDVDQAVGGAARVTIYYTDEAGHKVVHYFKKKA